MPTIWNGLVEKICVTVTTSVEEEKKVEGEIRSSGINLVAAELRTIVSGFWSVFSTDDAIQTDNKNELITLVFNLLDDDGSNDIKSQEFGVFHNVLSAFASDGKQVEAFSLFHKLLMKPKAFWQEYPKRHKEIARPLPDNVVGKNQTVTFQMFSESISTFEDYEKDKYEHLMSLFEIVLKKQNPTISFKKFCLNILCEFGYPIVGSYRSYQSYNKWQTAKDTLKQRQEKFDKAKLEFDQKYPQNQNENLKNENGGEKQNQQASAEQESSSSKKQGKKSKNENQDLPENNEFTTAKKYVEMKEKKLQNTKNWPEKLRDLFFKTLFKTFYSLVFFANLIMIVLPSSWVNKLIENDFHVSTFQACLPLIFYLIYICNSASLTEFGSFSWDEIYALQDVKAFFHSGKGSSDSKKYQDAKKRLTTRSSEVKKRQTIFLTMFQLLVPLCVATIPLALKVFMEGRSLIWVIRQPMATALFLTTFLSALLLFNSLTDLIDEFQASLEIASKVRAACDISAVFPQVSTVSGFTLWSKARLYSRTKLINTLIEKKVSLMISPLLVFVLILGANVFYTTSTQQNQIFTEELIFRFLVLIGSGLPLLYLLYLGVTANSELLAHANALRELQFAVIRRVVRKLEASMDQQKQIDGQTEEQAKSDPNFDVDITLLKKIDGLCDTITKLEEPLTVLGHEINGALLATVTGALSTVICAVVGPLIGLDHLLA